MYILCYIFLCIDLEEDFIQGILIKIIYEYLSSFKIRVLILKDRHF